MTNKDPLKEYNRARAQENKGIERGASRERHQAWKAERDQRRSQRQAEQKERIDNRPASHDSGFPQVSSRRMGIPAKVGSQHAKAEEKLHEQKQPTVGERMGRVVRPPVDDDREHKHGHSL